MDCLKASDPSFNQALLSACIVTVSQQPILDCVTRLNAFEDSLSHLLRMGLISNHELQTLLTAAQHLRSQCLGVIQTKIANSLRSEDSST